MARIIKGPSENDNSLKLSGIHLQYPVTCTIYTDFENLLQLISSTKHAFKIPSILRKWEILTCTYAYVVVGPDEKCFKPVQVYYSKDCEEHFLESTIPKKINNK